MTKPIAILILSVLALAPLAGQESRPKRERPERGSAAPKVNAVAPDFELGTEKSAETVKLSSFRDKKPVALIFGSYT